MGIDTIAKQKVVTFIIANKDVPRENRAGLVTQLTDELLSLGCSNVNLQTWTMKHPDLMRKPIYIPLMDNEQGGKKHTLLRILSDYIMDIDQVAERKVEYPVWNVEKELREEFRRNSREKTLILDEHTPDSTDEWSENVAGVYEYTFNESNPVEEAVFKDGTGMMSAQELRQLIESVKANPEKYIRKFADPERAWNQKRPDVMRTKRRVRAAIRKLDVTRVKSCRVCRNGFYSTHGRFVCDVLPSRIKQGVSVCDVDYGKEAKTFVEVAI